MMDDHQATIAWYVDDAKISHRDPRVVTWIIKENKKHFGALSLTRGKKHTYVGMGFQLLGDGSLSIPGKGYILEVVQDFGEDVSYGAVTPSSNDLFTVKDEGTTH